MQNLSDRMKDNQFATLHVTCEDCCKPFDINLERTSSNQIDITNGVIGNRAGQYLFKCPTCYALDKSFGTPCDIYSRVVGFYRPVNGWNNAKQEEFKLRKEYKMPE